MKFGYAECYEVDWVMQNTPPMVLEEGLGEYLKRALKRGGYVLLSEFTDNEVRAVAAAIKYNVDMLDELVKGYPKGHITVSEIRRRIGILKQAYGRLEVLVEL